MPISAAQSSDPEDPGTADRPKISSGRRLDRAAAAAEPHPFVWIDGGDGLDPVPGDDGASDRIAVVPGELVALHWIELPDGLSTAQATAAARLMVADVAAEPIDSVHVALGARSEQGTTCVALVSAERMSAWLAGLTGAGIDPDILLPETALLEASEDGFIRFDRRGVALCRGPGQAFAAEAALAEMVLAGRPVRLLSQEEWAAGLDAAIAHPLVNLRQGVFGRRHVRFEAAFARRLSLILLALVLVTIALHLAPSFRDTAAAGRMDADAREIAASSLPAGTSVVDPPAQMRERLTELGGGAGSFSAETSALFAALRATPTASLAGLRYERGTLTAAVKADSPATLAALRGRLAAAGYSAAGAPPRAGEGGASVQWLVRPR